MLKRLKIMASAFALAGLTLPLAAQQMTVTREAPPQTTPRKADMKTHWLLVFGKVLARTDKTGTTSYSYQNGQLVAEKLPNGIIGTYRYDAGKFSGIVYTDGRYINAVYNPNGTLAGLATNTNAWVTFSVKSKLTPLQAFAMVQNGMAALRNPSLSNSCVGTDDDANCRIIMEGTRPDDDWGEGGTIYMGQNDFPVTEEGSGGGGPIQNPPGETPAECKENVCKVTNGRMLQYCLIATNGPISHKKCLDKAGEFYERCKSSCETNDWSWLNWWVFFF